MSSPGKLPAILHRWVPAFSWRLLVILALALFAAITAYRISVVGGDEEAVAQAGAMEAEEAGYAAGFNRGKSEGYRKAYARAYKSAYRSAFGAAKRKAYKAAYRAAYRKSYQAAYTQGLEAEREELRQAQASEATAVVCPQGYTYDPGSGLCFSRG